MGLLPIEDRLEPPLFMEIIPGAEIAMTENEAIGGRRVRIEPAEDIFKCRPRLVHAVEHAPKERHQVARWPAFGHLEKAERVMGRRNRVEPRERRAQVRTKLFPPDRDAGIAHDAAALCLARHEPHDKEWRANGARLGAHRNGLGRRHPRRVGRLHAGELARACVAECHARLGIGPEHPVVGAGTRTAFDLGPEAPVLGDGPACKKPGL